MTKAEKLAALQNWQTAYKNLDAAFDLLKPALGYLGEGSLWDAVWFTFERYTDSVAALVDDNNGWLDWYCYECGMGSSPMAAILGEDRLDVDSLDKLLLCIEHDGKEARNGRA